MLSTIQRSRSQLIAIRHIGTNTNLTIKSVNLKHSLPQHVCNNGVRLFSVMQWRTSQPQQSPRLKCQTSIMCNREFSSFTRGFDLLAGSLRSGARRKIILDAYAPTGFDVLNLLHYPQNSADNNSNTREDEDEKEQQQMTHMNGSIIAFPNSCFLWNVSSPKDITIESLSLVLLHSPEIEFLFIGSDTPLHPVELTKLKAELSKRNIVVEQFDVTHAMGTFNILNGEDRRVAAALVLPQK